MTQFMMVKEMLGFEQCYLSDSFILMRRHLKKASFLSKDLFLAKLYEPIFFSSFFSHVQLVLTMDTDFLHVVRPSRQMLIQIHHKGITTG